MAFVVESFQPAPDARPFVFDELWLGDCRVRRRVHGSIRIDPLLHFYRARAVVEFVRYVRGLGGYAADLADERDLFQSALVEATAPRDPRGL